MEAAVIKFTVDKLGSALIEETLFLLDVHNQFDMLRNELRRMECFLEDADAKQQGDERVRNWVIEIRNVAYDAEDVIDTFRLKIGAAPKSGGLQQFKWKALMLMNLKYRHRVGREIQAIRSRLKDISDSRSTYGINNLGGNKATTSNSSDIFQQQFRNHYLHFEDDDVIGLEEHTRTLLTELLKDDERRCVLSIVGVGGLGKTTLAKKIYKHDTLMSRFYCRAWCSISQQLNLRDVLLEIIKKIINPNCNELKDLDDKELIEKLYKYLQDKRYLIVVDDLWSFEDWNTLSLAFPNGMRGSKVLLTTRNKRVASQADPWSFKLEPQLLNDEDSWELLCKKAFPKDVRDTKCYPAGLEMLGREMVHKCGGLPLAICVLGGLLATKKSKKEWEHINKDIPSNINEGKNGGVMGILALSYNDLPIHLKPCFLYFGLFPEDYAIPRKKLIQLWIAEGFIPNTSANTSLTMEDIGKNQYVAELIERCMIQADKIHIYTKTVKVCRIHDLMRDLCLSKAKETNFLDIYNHRIDDITPDTDASKRLRRYALHINDTRERYDEFYFNNAACSLRTLLIEIPYGSYLTPVKYENIRLLRVLDLVSVTKLASDLMEEVYTLIYLRYLALGCKEDKYFEISPSIGNLRNLQTLKVFRGRLPETISKLVQLRYLEIGGSTENFQIENLINLHSLINIRAGEWIRRGCLDKLSKLRKLSLRGASRMESEVIADEIVSKRSLICSHLKCDHTPI